VKTFETGESPFSQIRHVGVIVRDMDKAIKHYESLGIGPFKPLPCTVKERRAYGEVANIKLRVMVTQLGSVQFELIQPLEGESVQQEFLDKHGEGLHHLGFYTDDLERDKAKLVEMGCTVPFSARFVGTGGGDYYDTGGIGGLILELIQWPSGESIP